MVRGVAAAIGAIMVAACVAPHPVYTPEFETLPESRFRFEAGADSLFRQVDDPDAEAERMRTLRRFLDENHYCLKGYQITERKPVVVDSDFHRIYYQGVCL
jgi:hypothetical protein